MTLGQTQPVWPLGRMWKKWSEAKRRGGVWRRQPQGEYLGLFRRAGGGAERAPSLETLKEENLLEQSSSKVTLEAMRSRALVCILETQLGYGEKSRQCLVLEATGAISLLSSFSDRNLSHCTNSGLWPSLWANSIHHKGRGAFLSCIRSLPGEFSTPGSSPVATITVSAGSAPEIEVVTVQTYLPCAQHCARCFTRPISCIPHNDSEMWRC